MSPPRPVAPAPRACLGTILPLGALLSGFMLPTEALGQSPASTTAPAEQTLPTVRVTGERDGTQEGYAPGMTRIGKLPQEQRDIPASLTIVPEQLWRDQAADNLRDALRNVPGLTFNAGEGGRIGDNFTLRGYSVVGDLYLDTIRDVAQYNRDLFNLDRVEVLRGSASMLFGRGSTGGVINQVSKEPFLLDRYRADVTVGSYKYRRGTVDLNKQVGEDAAIRLNGMWMDSDSSRDNVSGGRWGVAPAVRWGIGTRDEFYLAYYYLSNDNIPDYGVPYYQGAPLKVPTSTFYGLANADFQTDTAGIGTAYWVHRFSTDTSFRSILRRGDYTRDLWATAPRLATNPLYIDAATVVNRQRQARGADETITVSQNDFTTIVKTGNVSHLILAGAELSWEETTRWNYANLSPNPSTYAINQNAFPILPPLYYNQRGIRTGQNSFNGSALGLYLQDFASIGEHWKVLLGARWDRLDAKYDPATGGAFTRDDREWSYRTGLIWQPNAAQSYYIAYGTSYNPSAELYSLDPRGVNTPPEENTNAEIGGKWELAGGDLFLGAALFRTQKTNERNTDLSTPDIFLLSGRRYTDGIELQAAGRLNALWEVFAGVAFMRAEITEASGQQANTLGKTPINTPPYTANLWTTYRFAPGWMVGGGFNAVGNRWGNAQNTNLVPGYWRWDAMIGYEQARYALRLNLINMFNADTYDGVYQGHVVPGTGRQLLFTISLKYD